MKKFDVPKRRFGTVIKEKRKELGLSQRDLSKKIANFSAGYIARIESGYSQPPAEKKILQLANVLSLSSKRLLYLASLEPKSPTKIIKDFPNTLALFQRVIALMSEEEKTTTVFAFEKRLGLLAEDPIVLANNFKRFLIGELSVDDYPGEGSRPICHYLKPWNKEIEEWIQPEDSRKKG